MMKIVGKVDSRKKPHSLLIDTLENISKDAFSKHFGEITNIIGNSSGVYALYDGNELYYVGKSTELRKRVKQHLRDRHLASWTHFSLYLVRKVEHIHEIESLLIRIANPKGNRIFFKRKSSGQLLRQLKAKVRQKQKSEFEGIFKSYKAKQQAVSKESSKNERLLLGLVPTQTVLYRNYKGKSYLAKLSPKGTISLGKEIFRSPSAAAMSVVKRPVNGWTFWYIKNSSGVWVKLSEYK